MKKRLKRYLDFRQRIKKLARKMSNMECCPLGKKAIDGWWRAEMDFNKLSEKWQMRIMDKVQRDLDKYYTVTDNGYSAAEMDSKMMGY